jgi:DNA helicase HerA-like ATPase
MATIEQIVRSLEPQFGVLAESSTSQLTVVARNGDVAIGDFFLLPCRRGPRPRFYVFRATEYANILNRTIDMGDVARNKLTMPDSYFAEDLAEEQLVELRGMVLGYAEYEEFSESWSFNRPRRLPQHLTDVYRVDPDRPESGEAVRELLRTQLGDTGFIVGHLLAGERPLTGVPVRLPIEALSHHVGVFGRTGCGKSNLIMVLLDGVLKHNRAVHRGSVRGRRASVFAIDPHDEFRSWHAAVGGRDGIRGIVEEYTVTERDSLVTPFYYLTARSALNGPLEARVQISRADIAPDDLASIMEFSEQQIAFARQVFADHGERWIGRLLAGDLGNGAGPEYLPGTIAAVERRLGFLIHGNTRLVSRFDPELGFGYNSLLPEILCAMESGRILIIETTLLGELEQFLLNTVVARALFSLRRALRLSDSLDRLREQIRETFGANEQDHNGRIGHRTLAEQLIARLEDGRLPYADGMRIRSLEELPLVHILVEEAPSVLNPERMRFGSVFRDISRQGRKFGIGLGVVSQQITELDNGVLTQLNTQVTMALGNAEERREAVRSASLDIGNFVQELQVLDRGQVLLTTSMRDIALPVQVPQFDFGNATVAGE